MRPLTFLYPTFAHLLFEAFPNTNLDKFSLKFSKNLTPCPNFIQIKKKSYFLRSYQNFTITRIFGVIRIFLF